MKDIEKVIKGLKCCVKEDACFECPYDKECEGCTTLKLKAIELLEELKAQLDKPTACDHGSIIQGYQEVCKLNDELCRVNVAYERTQRELADAQNELAYLRAIKATAEAFLGVKIDEHIR